MYINEDEDILPEVGVYALPWVCMYMYVLICICMYVCMY
jgi:hypothetical protein